MRCISHFVKKLYRVPGISYHRSLDNIIVATLSVTRTRYSRSPLHSIHGNEYKQGIINFPLRILLYYTFIKINQKNTKYCLQHRIQRVVSMSISLYPKVIQDNSLSPDHGGSEVDDFCQRINDATKGWGANKTEVIDALATQNSTTRYYMAIRYTEMYSTELVDVMKKEFSGDFGKAVKYLSLPSDKAECVMLHDAFKGIGAKINVVWSILIGRTTDELYRIKKNYFEMYSKDLTKIVSSECYGNMERIIINSIQGSEEKYDPQYHTADKALSDAEEIYRVGQGRWGTDEKNLFKVIFKAPTEHLRQIDSVYSAKYGYTLAKVMEKELGGNLKLAAVHYINMKLRPYEAIAALVKAACAGFGTDEFLLTCCIVRYQDVMAPVMTSHIELFGKTIHDRVRHEVSGAYKDALLAVLNTVWPETG